MAKEKVFLLGGLTGGPLMPLLAISRQLQGFESIIIGVKGGFEDRVAIDRKLTIRYLPKAKLNLLSFNNKSASNIIYGILDAFSNLLLLIFSFIKSIYLLLKYKPKSILNSGSFLAVPMLYSAAFLRLIGLIKTKIIIHQQDPLPGLANRLTVRLADYKTCVFDYTRTNYPTFANCKIIPNPLEADKFENVVIGITKNSELKTFLLNHSFNKRFYEGEYNKPMLLIYGGGTGAEFINYWVWQNLEELTEHFNIIHLMGALQKANLKDMQEKYKSINYLLLDSLLEDMPTAISTADMVICRAGMASITELGYLNKRAFLVPIPHSHQELNAKLVKDKFTILEQNWVDNWLPVIIAAKSTLPIKQVGEFDKDIIDKLQKYYKTVQDLTAK